MKRVLVTGAHGFIGRNLVLALRRHSDIEVVSVDIDSPAAALDRALEVCEIVYHLAGVNRPEKETEYEEGNTRSLQNVLSRLEKGGRNPLIVLSSSAQAVLDNPYGLSKRKAEELLCEFSEHWGIAARIYRLPGVFGKFCRPNYNSVVATFCHNIARGLPIHILDVDREIEIVHVDDVVAAFLSDLKADRNPSGVTFEHIEPIFRVKLGTLAERLKSFHAVRETLTQPSLADPLDRRLYGTYMSYLPNNALAYELPRKQDNRGALSEFLKMEGHGQIFISRTLPGITRGNHYHDLKVEKFVVVQGDATIRFRHMASNERSEYSVSGSEFRVVDIPPGWTHSIENVGSAELVVLFWSSEAFNPADPDTHAAEVLI
ncbi:MAG: NAD-dependent epimerase/dehydratase family protein [Candidatus Aminicenantales bacterium]|jgi:UDP-2-acetamido-2,6-beta-L-arabino-hexul-4-ose reductase